MVKAVFLFTLAFAIDALSLSYEEAVDYDEAPDPNVCNEVNSQTARRYIEEKNWDALKDHVCTVDHQDEVRRLQDGTADVADIGEWLDGKFDDDSDEVKFAQRPLGCRTKKLPKVFIPCCGHSGSTTLARKMQQHPQLNWGVTKEHVYFPNHRFDLAHNETHEHYSPNYVRYYKNQFPVNCDQIAFDATIGAFDLDKSTIQAMKNILGADLKIIWLIRDPPNWVQSLKNDHAPGYGRAHNGCYADFMENWLSVFGTEHMKFVSAEEYWSDEQATLDDIFEFIGVSPFKLPEDVISKASGRRRSQHLTKEEVATYHAQPHNQECSQRLLQLSKRTFDWMPDSVRLPVMQSEAAEAVKKAIQLQDDDAPASTWKPPLVQTLTRLGKKHPQLNKMFETSPTLDELLERLGAMKAPDL